LFSFGVRCLLGGHALASIHYEPEERDHGNEQQDGECSDRSGVEPTV
jgi:hypothetical protein